MGKTDPLERKNPTSRIDKSTHWFSRDGTKYYQSFIDYSTCFAKNPILAESW